MKEFNWTTCLNKGKGVALTLKQNEEDFIVREGAKGSLANISDSTLETQVILDDLPLVTEKLLSSLESIGERRAMILGRITKIEKKEERTAIHKIYSTHPFIYTKSVKNIEGSSDILVLFDTHHKMHTFSVTVTKKGKTTQDAVDVLARYLKVSGHSIKYAGNKDKKAITTQRMSIEGVSYIAIYKLKSFLKAAQNKATSETPEYHREKEDGNTEIDCIFTSRSREITDKEIENKSIVAVEGSKIIRELEVIQNRLHAAKSTEQTNEEYIEEARKIEEGIVIGSIERVEGGIKLGDLERNRFYLNLEIRDGKDQIREKIAQIKENGFANYYGQQRFGHGMTNHIVGEALINKEYGLAVTLILKGLEGLSNSPKAKKALELIEEQKYTEADNILPGKFQTEKTVIKSLSKKIPPKVILNRIRRESRMLYLHSYQSKIFNDSLEQRLKEGPKEEEYVIKEPISSITNKEEIAKSLSKEHSPKISDIAIPLYPMQEIGQKEAIKSEIKGGFRKAVIIPHYIEYAVKDNTLHLSFDLPPGTYATMLVKEIAHNEVNEITGPSGQ